MEIPEHRKWMYNRLNGKRRSAVKEEFCDGVNQFIDFATSQETFVPKYDLLRCPCVKCKCLRYIKIDEVKAHLLSKGFMPNYYIWTSHGEKRGMPRALENRAVDSGASSYIGGRMSAAQHRKRPQEKEHKESDELKMMEKSKKLKVGNQVCTKVHQDEFCQQRPETQGNNEESSSFAADNAHYLELVGGNCEGNVLGTGELGDLVLSQGAAQQDSSIMDLKKSVVELMTVIGPYKKAMEARIQQVEAQRDEAIVQRDAYKAAARLATEAARVAADAANRVTAAIMVMSHAPPPDPQPPFDPARERHTNPPVVPDCIQNVYLS